jgi:small-conductance mechanosensitive channel
MSASTTDSIYDVIDYICDKFNIHVEYSNDQVTSFVSRFGHKIIAYSILIDALGIALFAVAIFLLYRYVRKPLKKNYIKDFREHTKELEKDKKYIIAAFLDFLAWILIIVSTIKIAFIIFHIGQCILFPEKIILEFVGNYM